MTMESFALTYKNNREALLAYRWRCGNEPPPWEDLEAKAVKIGEHEYAYRQGDGMSESVTIERTNINTHPFFRDLSKPLLVIDEMNSYHWEYLMDNVRASEDYGADNHIYMHYATEELFCLLLQVVDITPYLASEKFVVSWGGTPEENYPIDFKKEYGIDYASMGPKPVRVDEICRIVVNWPIYGYSGNVFLDNVLDWHKNLLTIRFPGVVQYPFLYERFLKGKSPAEAFSLWRNADGVGKKAREHLGILFSPVGDRGIRLRVPEIGAFFSCLQDMFPPGHIPTKMEWFKGIFLAYSETLGRSLPQRIAPAIEFAIHGGDDVNSSWDMQRDFTNFKYIRCISPLRRFTIRVGSGCEIESRRKSGTDWLAFPNYMNFVPVRSTGPNGPFLPADDKFLPCRGIVRFEDLKLYPRATLEAVCDFLDIPWDDSLLSTTANGTETAMTRGRDHSVKGFDTSPVYNRHEKMFGPFDYYRMEVVMGDDWAPWGYKPLYHTDGMQYTTEEILKMFELPFKCEKFHYTKKQQDSTTAARQWMYDAIREKLSHPVDITKDGRKLVPIPWIKPKMELVEGELYE